jgi:hypothetical protein
MSRDLQLIYSKSDSLKILKCRPRTFLAPQHPQGETAPDAKTNFRIQGQETEFGGA